MSKRRIQANAMIKIDAADTLYFSSLREFHGKTGIAVERLRGGDWLVKIGQEQVALPLKILRPI